MKSYLALVMFLSPSAIRAPKGDPTFARPQYEGEVRFGSPVDVCCPGDQLTYQELDPATETYSTPVSARCGESVDVEL